MPFCYACGSQVQAGVSPCPVCDVPIVPPTPQTIQAHAQTVQAELVDGLSEGAARAKASVPAPVPVVEARRKLWLFWRMVSVVAALTVAVMAGADALGEPGMSWALFAMPSVAVGWWLFSTALWLRHHGGWMLLTQWPAVVGLLVLLDLVDQNAPWFLTLGLPLSAIAWGWLAMVWATRRLVQRRWPVVAWVGLVLLVPACIGIELLVDAHLAVVHGDAIRLHWSLVVAAAIAPLAGFGVYVDVYLRRYRIDLWRYLHT